MGQIVVVVAVVEVVDGNHLRVVAVDLMQRFVVENSINVDLFLFDPILMLDPNYHELHYHDLKLVPVVVALFRVVVDLIRVVAVDLIRVEVVDLIRVVGGADAFVAVVGLLWSECACVDACFHSL